MTGPAPKLRPFKRVKSVLLEEVSFSDPLSDRMTLVTVCKPAKPRPWRVRPSSSMAHACAPAARALPIMMKRIDAWRTECRPKTSAICPYSGMVDVEASVNAVTIQLSWVSAAVKAINKSRQLPL